VKIGIYLPVYGGWLRGVNECEEKPTFQYVVESAKMAETMGIDSIWVPDHMLNPIKGVREGCLEAWTTLSALASITDSVELFHTTLCQGFRYPAVLAKMAATLDEVSNGRFRFALGAGWFKREFEAYGAPWYDHDTKIQRAREQIEIIKALWTQPTTNYKGRFYEIINGILEPKPVQKPHPPIWWGGESEKSRELVADLADGWLMNASTLDEAEEKIQDMHKRLDSKCRRKIQYAIPGKIYLGKTDEEARERLRKLFGDKVDLLNNTLAKGFVGSPNTILEKIHRLTDLGFDYIIFQCSPAINTLEEIEEIVIELM
jgi:FMNH2-dependent dimethyl sulfone monooxygenase